MSRSNNTLPVKKSSPILTIKKPSFTIINKNSEYPTKRMNDFIAKYSSEELIFFKQLLSQNPVEDYTVNPSLTEEENDKKQLEIFRKHICVINKYMDSVSYETEEYRRRIEDIEEEIRTKYCSHTLENLTEVQLYNNLDLETPEVETPETETEVNYIEDELTDLLDLSTY